MNSVLSVRSLIVELGGNSRASTSAGYGDHLVLNMSRRIMERALEDSFIRHLKALGIRVEEETDI